MLTRWWAKAFAAPYGVVGRIGVTSVCCGVSACPKISTLEACTNRTRRPTDSCNSRADCSSAATDVPVTAAVFTGSCHDRATELMPPRL
jgi:hypothetical protein